MSFCVKKWWMRLAMEQLTNGGNTQRLSACYTDYIDHSRAFPAKHTADFPLSLFLSRLSFSQPVDAVFVVFPVSCLPITCQKLIMYSYLCSIHTMPTNHYSVCFRLLHFNRDVRIIPDGLGRFSVSSSWQIDSWLMATMAESQPTQGGEIQLEHASMKIHIDKQLQGCRRAIYGKLTEAYTGSLSSQHAYFYNCATVQYNTDW